MPDPHQKMDNPFMAVIGTIMIVWAIVGSVGKCASGDYSHSDIHPHAHGDHEDDWDHDRPPVEALHGVHGI